MKLQSNKRHFPQQISDEVQELINYRPSWTVRNATIVFFFIIFGLFVISWFIRYPDVINGIVTLVADNPPELIVARDGGRLEKLLVTNEQNVIKDQPVAFLQSIGSHDQVLALKKWLGQIETWVANDSLNDLANVSAPSFNQLGELQSDFQNFENVLIETLQIVRPGYYKQKQHSLLGDLAYLNSIHKNTLEQQQLLKRDYELQQQEYSANVELAKDSIIAPIELRQNESKVIGKRNFLQQNQAQLINNELSQHNKEKEILDLNKYISDKSQKFRSEFYNLKSKTNAWIQQFVVLAPADGKILFASFLQENQLLSAGEELFYDEPKQTSFYGQLLVSQVGLGKIRTGQEVIMRVQSFPSEEFGVLNGVVNYISSFPNSNDSFLIRVNLSQGLRTDHNKRIVFRNNLVATGEVITDERKLFDRFFGQLKHIFQR